MDYGMVAADSECSSGCESGWTLYFENSFISTHPSCKGNNFETQKSLKQKQEEDQEDEEEEEDLSMVSDASSGPPNFHQEEEYGQNIINGCHYYAPISNPKNNSKRQKAKEKKQLSVLDDTASSPIFDFSNNNFSINKNTNSVENVLDFSQGYSTNHFQGRSTYQEHYGYFQSSLLPGNNLQENQWFEEKRWG